MPQVRKTLIGRYGSLAHAWLRVFDKRPHVGYINFPHFRQCLVDELGFYGDAWTLWSELVGEKTWQCAPSARLYFEQWDGPAYRHLLEFGTLARKQFQEMKLAFRHGIDVNGSGSVQLGELGLFCTSIGFTGSVAGLFHCLDLNTIQALFLDDFLWLDRWPRGSLRCGPHGDAWELERALLQYGILPREEGTVLPPPKDKVKVARPSPGSDCIAEGLCAKCGRLVHKRRHRCYGCGEPTKTLHRVVGFAAGRTEAPLGLDYMPGILKCFEHKVEACTQAAKYKRLTPFKSTAESYRMEEVRARRAEAAADAEVANVQAEPEASHAAGPPARYIELQKRRTEMAKAASAAAMQHVRTYGFEVQDCRSTPSPL